MSPVAAEFKATYLGREERLPRQLKLLMVLRVILVFLLLGVTTYLQSRQKSEFIDVPLKILYVLCGASFVLTIFYSLALGKGVHPRKLAYLQVIGDVAFINVLMFITNGYDVFTFLYVVNIVSGSILLRRRGALVISLLSALSYALLIDLQYFSILPVVSGRELPVASLDELVNNIFWNTGAFLGVAFLSGYLSEELQRVGQKLQEKQIDLEDLENLNRNIVESLSSGLITINEEGRILSFNRSAEEITGYSFEQVFLQPIDHVFEGLLAQSKDTSGRWEYLFRRRTDQKELILGFSSAPLKHQGNRTLGQIINFQDVTLVKHMQDKVRESDKLAVIGRLAASIAHEIRNPLASMSGSIQMLRHDLKPTGEHRALMDIVLRETERLNGLIRDFLDFAKPAKSRREAMQADAAIRETVAVCRQQVALQEASRVTIELALEGEGLWIESDPAQFRQLLWNLLLNAVQAIEGPGKIYVRFYEKSGREGRACLEVEDTGCGIPEEKMEFIYEPFYTTKQQGTGMGLATVRRIVDDNQWIIDLVSRAGKGTTFRIWMPLVEKSNQVQPAPPQTT